MARSNVDAIYEEYPFLEEILSREEVVNAQVSRWSEGFLDSRASRRKEIYLLDEEGAIICRIVKPFSFFKFIKNPFVEFLMDGDETVGEALVRIGNEASRVSYAVECREGCTLSFYKLPKGYAHAESFYSAIIEAKIEIVHDLVTIDVLKTFPEYAGDVDELIEHPQLVNAFIAARRVAGDANIEKVVRLAKGLVAPAVNAPVNK